MQAVFNHFWCYLSDSLHKFFLRGHLNISRMLRWWILPSAFFTPWAIRFFFFFCWQMFDTCDRFFSSLLLFSHVLKWTICHMFVVLHWCLHAVTGVSTHWKWSALILSPYFFLIRWFVSLGNRSQAQPHCLWKIKPTSYPFLCGNRLMNKILTGKKSLDSHCEWAAHGWKSQSTNKPKYFFLPRMLTGFESWNLNSQLYT